MAGVIEWANGAMLTTDPPLASAKDLRFRSA
jgi:hypothetical protein